MMPIESLLAFTLASFLLSIAPGPDNIFVLAQSALYGRKSGILVVLGLCTGLVAHTTAVALGIAVVFQTSVIAFTLLKLLGALYLLYLAWQAFHAPATALGTLHSNIRSSRALYLRSIIINITNPKVSIFFLAFLPQFSSPENGPLMPQIFLLGGVFILVALVTFSIIALLAGELGNWFHRSPKIQRYLNRLAGAVFVGLALKLVTASLDGE
ncbi:MAG: LysE family translocator [Pseudomonadales bacterium]